MTDENIERVLVALRRVTRATDIHSRNLIKTTGVTAPQLLLMQIIMRNGEMSVGDLAKAMNLSQATVTTILDRLAIKQYIVRTRSSSDKRKVHIRLTDQAREAIKDAPVPLQKSFVSRFKNLDDWEQSMIIAALQKVAKMMDADSLEPLPMLDIDVETVMTAASELATVEEDIPDTR